MLIQGIQIFGAAEIIFDKIVKSFANKDLLVSWNLECLSQIFDIPK